MTGCGEGAVGALQGKPELLDVGDQQVVETIAVQVSGDVDPWHSSALRRAVGRGHFRENALGAAVRIEPFNPSVAVHDEAVAIRAAHHIDEQHAVAKRCVDCPRPVRAVESVELHMLPAVFARVHRRERHPVAEGSGEKRLVSCTAGRDLVDREHSGIGRCRADATEAR